MAIHSLLLRLLQRIKRPNMLSSAALGAGTVFIIQVIGIGLSYILHVFLARWMGAAEYGVYIYILAWISLLAIIAGLGFPNAVLRFISQYRTQRDWPRMYGVILRSWGLVFSASVGVSLLGTAFILGINFYKGIENAAPLLLGIWLVPPMALLGLQTEMAKAIYKMILAFSPRNLIYPLLVILCAFWFYHERRVLTSMTVIGITLMALLFVLVVQVWLFRRGFSPEVSHARPVYETREWLHISFPLLIVTGLGILLNQTDVLMLGPMLGSKEVGIYNAAKKSSNVIIFALHAVNAVAAPMFASLHSQGNRAGLQHFVSTIVHWIFWPALAIGIFMVIFSGAILRLFGPQFVAAQWPLAILVLGQLVNAGAGSVGYLMIMTGHQDQCARVLGWTVLANILLNAIGIYLLGILGAALATAVSIALWNFWLHYLVVKNLGVRPSIVSASRLSDWIKIVKINLK